MSMRTRVIRIMVPLYAVFVFLNLFPFAPGLSRTDVVLIMFAALIQTICGGGIVLLILIDPGKPADECGHG
ncbi:MAG: hypothetical protein CMJ83_17875 [Planctomycetes bacterium]|nr:hypothetical protein [Planctomycetota bacterium]